MEYRKGHVKDWGGQGAQGVRQLWFLAVNVNAVIELSGFGFQALEIWRQRLFSGYFAYFLEQSKDGKQENNLIR